MLSPTGVIPDELMHFSKRKEALAFITALAVPVEDKLRLFQGWASWVGTHTSPRERRLLENSSNV